MYEKFFGLREKPFKLVPDPEYLYLSPSHAKTLSNLSSALEHGDGFVLIVGEVGTGKTTLCRYFLNELDDSVAFAYIFNTQLEGLQLLAAICHEFGILAHKEAHSQCDGYGQASSLTSSEMRGGSQALIQSLNDYLIAQHQCGRKVILLIDEAQNLTSETLEMVRLLSNLETTRHKLLHIILVGQPELADKLSTYPMRQLSQRISVHCRLSWLNRKQTRAFIEHRLQIALSDPCRLFSSHAFRIIYRYSHGIPRQINIVAHRCLGLAYEQRKTLVSGAIARMAVKELVSFNPAWHRSSYLHTALAISAVLSILIVAGVIVLFGPETPSFFQSIRLQDDALSVAHNGSTISPSTNQIVFKVPSPPVAVDQPSPITALETRLATSPKFEPTFEEQISKLDPIRSRDKALAHLLSMWKQPSPNTFQFPDTMNHDRFFVVTALQYGLRLLVIQENFELVRKLNLPVIVSIKPATMDVPLFGVLTQWQDDKVRVVIDDVDTGMVDFAQMKNMLGEKIYLFWQNALADYSVISQKSQGASVLQVKQMLDAIGYHHLPESPFVDPPTYHAIVDFQISQGIEPDGLIGPVTKILLFQVTQAIQMPQLDDPGPGRTDGAGT